MIYLLRHGLDNESFIGGWSEIPLTKEGVYQVVNAASKINQLENLNIKKVIASSVRRATQTAEIVTPILGINNYEVNDLLKEQNKGHLNGMEKHVAKNLYPEYMDETVQTDTVYPDGESLKELYERIRDNLEYFASLEDDTLLITHRGVINMLYYILNDIPLDMNKTRFDVTHASLHECDIKNKQIRKVL